ncbi:murein hydrolase activator EnvC family protein [Hyphomonas johnsonii]|uniref:M23 family peptidase n=1 Tax=Hyphomonas johnsonii MHS-2 TaxID=1280950 RepID=A0A059FMB3_9PROT|nr:peptidoglycan DD-metalloendopeptidase family protein [Hyphomonas johnsonii]KCZ91583.1 M23 family peptidase [Hyphomonas johnsonii MHS-2]
MRPVFRPLLLMCAALSLIGATPDSFTREELEALEAERQAAITRLEALQAAGEDTETDIRQIDSKLIAAAMESRRREEQAVASEKALIDLGTRRVVAQEALLEDRQALEDLLAALAASNRRKPPALIVSPGKANTAVRRAILMSQTTPRLAARADTLGAEIDELNALERHIRGERARLEAAEATLALKRVEIEQLAAVKRGNFEDISGDIHVLRDRAASLERKAETLRDLLAALETGAPAAPGIKPVRRPILASAVAAPRPSAARAASPTPVARPLGKAALGRLIQPTAGNVVYGFGDKMATGGKTEWITFSTRQAAQVVAPIDGTVEYARPFRSYGSMLILRTSDGYHVILTGMSRIYVTEGQRVSANEPVGRMPDRADPAPELNMELRLGDKVMNPAQWLASDR